MRLPLVRDTLQLDVFLAALAISMVLPIGLFIVFRRFFISGDAMARGDQRLTATASDEAPAEERPATACVAGERNERRDQRLIERTPSTINAPLRATCHHDSGAADSAPKHAHGGCCPRAR